jgi:hypothetical protein
MYKKSATLLVAFTTTFCISFLLAAPAISDQDLSDDATSAVANDHMDEVEQE